VDAHTDARTQFLVARPSYEHVPRHDFSCSSIRKGDRIVVLIDPPARDAAESLPSEAKAARLVEPEEACAARWDELDDDGLKAEIGQYR
jgi:hypothetical protein